MSSVSTRISASVKESASVRERRAPLNTLRYLQRQPRIVHAQCSLCPFVLIAWLDLVLLHEGDVPAAYTDGLVEAMNPQREEFGEERLQDTVRSSLSLSAAEICKRIADRLQASVAESPQWDDNTLVVIKVKPV